MVKYLYCDKCGGYYILNPGESPDDFSDRCECGGHLILGEMAEKTEEEKLKELAHKQVSSERNKEFLRFFSSIDFFPAVAIGAFIGFCSIFIIYVNSSFAPVIFSLFAFVGSSFITSLIIKRNPEIPLSIIPNKINNNPKFRRANAGIITSMTVGSLIGLAQGALTPGHIGDIFLEIIFFMILSLILGIIGGSIEVMIRDLISKIKSVYFPSESLKKKLSGIQMI
jgi:hypothetical protein